jgi:hypothetical protein
MATYAIVHSTVSGMLRRVIADDEGNVALGEIDGQPAVVCKHSNAPDGYHPLAPGESAVIAEGAAAEPQHWRAHIKSRAGVDPPDLVCALIDQGIVTDLIHADPDVDQSPDDRLMVLAYSPQIMIGCSYDEASGLFSLPPGLLPPHTPGNATSQPIDVPPTVIARE